MNHFVLQEWEEVGARINQEEFVPMQTEVYRQESQITGGLLNEAFEEPIKYASGPRTHSSKEAIRKEQQTKVRLEEEAAQRISLTQAEIDELQADAYSRGREEALAESVITNNDRFIKMEQQFKNILMDLSAQEKTSIVELERDALNLALDISHRIMEQAVEINPEYIIQIIRQALKLSGGARIKKVRVSPQDMEFIRVLKVAQSIKEFDGSWIFEADETIKAGCILESSAGTIDFELEKAWERIRDKILTISK